MVILTPHNQFSLTESNIRFNRATNNSKHKIQILKPNQLLINLKAALKQTHIFYLLKNIFQVKSIDLFKF